jgi:hypothetical protein
LRFRLVIGKSRLHKPEAQAKAVLASDFVLALLPLPTLTLVVSQCTDVTITGGGGEGGGGVGRLTLVVAWAVKGIAWLRSCPR